MDLIILSMIGLWLTSAALVIYGTLCYHRHFRTTHRRPPPVHRRDPVFPPISLLKPLKGIDSELIENLRSCFQFDYPAPYEILFAVADAHDPARTVAETLMAAYPQISARIFVGAVEVGTNPKVNNLMRAYEACAHDWVLISDSNVQAGPHYLRKMVQSIEPGVGMVTSVVAGIRPRGIGGHLEAIYLNTFYARGMTLAARFSRTCVIGKSMLFRKSVAKRFGGLRNLSRYLAEDYMAGEAMRSLGLRVVLADEPVPQNIGDHSLEAFWSRHLRWGRIRKFQSPLVFLAELAGGSVFSGIIGATALSATLSCPMLPLFTGHLIVMGLCDLSVAVRNSPRSTRLYGIETGLAWLLREFLAIPLWIHIAIGNSVLWRGKRLILSPGGLVNDQDVAEVGDWNPHATLSSRSF